MGTYQATVAKRRVAPLRWLLDRDLEGETRLGKGILITCLAVGVVVTIFPLYWMLRTVCMDATSQLRTPLYLFPPSFHLVENFQAILANTKLPRSYRNTVIYAVLSVVNVLFVNVPAGYAFARLRFPGRDRLFMLYLALMMLPGDATVVSRFVILKNLGFYNNWAGLVLPLSAAPFTIFMLRQFFLGIPRELEEAAMMEGCSELGVLWHVIMPLSKPVLVLIAMWTAQAAWEDFWWPLIITWNDTLRTAAVTIYSVKLAHAGEQMAALLTLQIPIFAMAAYAQRHFREGFARALVIG